MVIHSGLLMLLLGVIHSRSMMLSAFMVHSGRMVLCLVLIHSNPSGTHANEDSLPQLGTLG